MKKTKKASSRPKPKAKVSAQGPVSQELSEEQLEAVAGGRKAGGDPVPFLKITLNDTLISGVSD
jgi:hypothetical protein